MKAIALVLLAALAVACILMFSPAEALTAATITDKATFTSLVSGRWDTVWSNSTHTHFIDAASGSFKSVILDSDGDTVTTATQTLSTSSNDMAVSDVETVSGVRRVYVVQLMSSSVVEVNIVNINTGGIISATNDTLSVALTAANGIVDVSVTKNRIYFSATADSSDTVYRTYSDTRTPSGTMTHIAARTTSTNNIVSLNCAVESDGAAAASDEVVCIVGNVAGGAGTVGEVQKWSGSGVTDIGDLCVNNQASTNAEIMDTTDKMIIRMTCAGTENVHTYTKATDTLSAVLQTTDWLTWNKQQTDFDGTTRSFQSGNKVYMASSSYPIAYIASSGVLNDPDTCYAESVSAGTITCINDSIYYRISDGLVVSGVATTWTPRAISGNAISPTVYSENVATPLTANSTVINDDVIELVCDAAYTLGSSVLIVGDDSDCTRWHIFDENTALVGRTLNYNQTIDLVHAVEFVGYTIHVSAAAPEQYFLTTIYDGKNVDSGNFDSGGDAAQRLLYGQCYSMVIEESASGNILLSGEICANDVNPKTVSLTGITLPDEWLGTIWSHQITRYFNASDAGAPASANSTNNHVLFTLEKSVKPYNASINIVDHPDETYRTLDEWHNFTSVTGVIVVNRTGIFSNQTLYFSVLENGVVVLNDVSQGRLSPGNIDLVSWADNYGLLFGVPIALIFPVLTAAVFPRSQAHIGVIATGAVLGIEQYFGLLKDVPFNEGLWAVAFGLIALGVMYAKR